MPIRVKPFDEYLIRIGEAYDPADDWIYNGAPRRVMHNGRAGWEFDLDSIEPTRRELMIRNYAHIHHLTETEAENALRETPPTCWCDEVVLEEIE